ncbi:Protein of unknown function [Bacillus mycoides]|nr:Protein of unknown function [Bacillus mycoides]
MQYLIIGTLIDSEKKVEEYL